jgi:hypothetical protein
LPAHCLRRERGSKPSLWLKLDHQDLLEKIQDMENRHDDQFREIFDWIRHLTAPPDLPQRPIGFVFSGRT